MPTQWPSHAVGHSVVTPQSSPDEEEELEVALAVVEEVVDELGGAETTVAKVVGDGASAFRSATLATVSTLGAVSTFSFTDRVGSDAVIGVEGVDIAEVDVELPLDEPPEEDVELPSHISASSVE